MTNYYKKAIYKQEKAKLLTTHKTKHDSDVEDEEEEDDNKPLSHYIKMSDYQKEIQEQWKQQRGRIKQYYNSAAHSGAQQRRLPLIDAIPALSNNPLESNHHNDWISEKRNSTTATTTNRPFSSFSQFFTPTSTMLLLLDQDANSNCSSNSSNSSIYEEEDDDDDDEDSIPIGLLHSHKRQPLSAAEKYKEKVKRTQRLQQEQQRHALLRRRNYNSLLLL